MFCQHLRIVIHFQRARARNTFCERQNKEHSHVENAGIWRRIIQVILTVVVASSRNTMIHCQFRVPRMVNCPKHCSMCAIVMHWGAKTRRRMMTTKAVCLKVRWPRVGASLACRPSAVVSSFACHGEFRHCAACFLVYPSALVLWGIENKGRRPRTVDLSAYLVGVENNSFSVLRMSTSILL